MITRNSRRLSCALLICGLMFVGCAGKNQSKVSPDVDSKVAKKLFIKAYLDSLAAAGCSADKKFKDTPGPLKEYREKIKLYYGFFLDSDGYKGERKILDGCSSIEAIDRFFDVFWSIRDPDINTPENENKQLIDKRIDEIKREVLLADHNVQGTTFSANGGFRGDMAHVYLFRGNSHYKFKTTRTTVLADLVAWVYFDENGRPLYVFLFYNKGMGYQLFRNLNNFDNLDAIKQTLQQLARIHPTTDEDFERLYRELMDNDQEYIFRFAIRQVSYYPDVKLDKVLAPPTPESMTAKAIQPRILGVPNIPKSIKMIMSEHHTKITGYSQLIRKSDGGYDLKLTISIAGVDWENSGENLKSDFDLAIYITNEKTREKKYFTSGLHLDMPSDRYSKLYFIIGVDNIPNQIVGLEGTTLPDLFKSLAPGDYEIKIYLINQKTYKSGTWYQYITITK